MSYASPQDMINRYPNRDLVQLTNEDPTVLTIDTALLKQRQDANTSSITALQSFTGLFTGMMAQNGYVEIPFKDVNRADSGDCAVGVLLTRRAATLSAEERSLYRQFPDCIFQCVRVGNGDMGHELLHRCRRVRER